MAPAHDPRFGRIAKSKNSQAQSGIITGSCASRGQWIVTLSASNSLGQAAGRLRIACGDTLALTPPMGFNDWYAYYDRVSDLNMRHAADIMVSSGMADVGYQYVDIDDCWASATNKNRDPDRVGPLRDDKGNILPNKYFPDMKALTDYIHSRGLKAGIYSSPGKTTCAGFTGSWQHEADDARQFAGWGFDLLKYDWCSYRKLVSAKPSLQELQRPYALMGGLLKQQPRDIVFNLCQYGKGNVWEWGADVDANSWRTSDDLGPELSKFFDIALKNAGLRAYARPGQWNDPDYIQIGLIGSARGMGRPRPCGMTAAEQYAFMSLWCLTASPLFYSGDIERLDPLTINVLTNPEVIDVDQDPLGQTARAVQVTDASFILVKNMEDGSKAVGLCNRGTTPISMSVDWATLGLTGKQIARDLWREKDLGTFDAQFSGDVPPHGVLLVRLRPAD